MRSRAANTVLLLCLLLLWTVCLGLSLRSSLRPMGYPPVRVKASPEPEGYPVVTGFAFGFSEQSSGLRVGDRLLRLGKADLRGAGSVGLFVHVAGEAGPDLRVPVSFERGGQRQQATLRVGSCGIFLPRLLASIAFMAAALILHFRARPSRLVRVLVQTHVCAAFLFACTFTGGWLVTVASIPVHVISLTLGAPLAMRGALMFPHGVSPEGKLATLGPWIFGLLGPLDASRVYAFPFPREAGLVGLPAVSVLFLVAMLAALTRNYRESDPIGRRQLKWNLLGVYCACAPPMALAALSAFVPRLAEYVVLGAATLGFIPLFLIVSILRYNLLDIDRLISVTASYSVLSVVLLATFLAAVPTVARAVSSSTGAETATTQIALSLIMAAVVVPLHGRLRPQIDRVFFAERWALLQGTGKLLADLATCRGAEQLIALLGERLDRLLRPESCVIYGRGAKTFSPVFVRGQAVPPVIEASSSFISLVQGRPGAISIEELSRGLRNGALSQLDQAALESLGGPVVLPVRRGQDLVAFVCLGPKRSGDVYTATDLAFLTTVADKVSLHLQGLDQEKVIRESLAMQEALRRYVPGELAAHLEGGRELQVGECEVTILFVDIRGYSSFAEGRKPFEVFSTVNRYTQAVSEVVRSQGGNVVEFNGDGMMAVFGAPRGLPQKEQAAVEAALAIIPAVGDLRVEAAVAESFPLSVGVGIATGEVFVGNVQAADRLIWTAIGATTNLAARLQGLTRELDAAIVMDALTWERASVSGRPFRKLESLRIRGLERPTEIYALPYA